MRYLSPPERIADRVVPDEYHAISEKIDALYLQQLQLPADYETTGMVKLRREAHARMLGNGLCTRPAQLDCRMEIACETCTYFQTTIEFRPVIGSHRPVGVVNRRRTSFHLQWCRSRSMRMTRHQAKLSSMLKMFFATACRK